MPTPKITFNLRDHFKDNFVAFLDVMGFSDLVNSGNIQHLEEYFDKITKVIDQLKKDKEQIESFIISDSIILIAPSGLQSLRSLISAIRRIQSAIIWRKVLLRGAISYGSVYYNSSRNLIVGKGYIRAYRLESEAKFPRVIIDPAIIKLIGTDKTEFLKLTNKSLDYNFEDRLVYTKSQFSSIQEDGIFVDYANKSVLQESINGNLEKVYNLIIENLYKDQSLYSKYIWLRDYYLEILKLTNASLSDESVEVKRQKRKIVNWISKFERL